MSSLRQESQSQRHPLIRPINLTSSSDRLAQAPWYQREQLSHAMPDLSPSLTLLLQLPHLDEEVEALVITTGNYLISLSQQLGLSSVNTQIYRAISDAIDSQILPQIQTALYSASGHLTQNRWNVPSERPGINPEENCSNKTRKNSRSEQFRDRPIDGTTNASAYDSLIRLT